MTFSNFLNFVCNLSSENIEFKDATHKITEYINDLPKDSLIEIVRKIGIIPESIETGSSTEKLFSKASDCVLAKCFNELGMPSIALSERGNSADIIARSTYHGYTLVADAKTFRMSRTAKNQKDFKIDTLSNWRGAENDFAIIVAPYFQYPNTESQIYSSALDKKVCLLSWEHILFLLLNNKSENENFSLEPIWKAPDRIARDTRIAYADRMKCLFPYINQMVCDRISKSLDDFQAELQSCKEGICARANDEINCLEQQKIQIQHMTRDEAINQLLKITKIDARIKTIEKFVAKLG